MARLRKFTAYRRLERAYTRISKYRKYSFVRSRPNSVISKFEMGNKHSSGFNYELYLVSKSDLQIRHNALEAARQSANRLLEKTFGKEGYFFKLMVYPHHVLRENPIASGAGADRLSTGMAQSFGKPISTAARIHEHQRMFMLRFNDKAKLDVAKEALERASKKLPTSCYVVDNSLKMAKA